MLAIADFEDQYGYEFETQPIHFEVLYEEDEEYWDPSVGEESLSPEYGAISAAHYQQEILPKNVPYEVLNELHIPVYESRLTFIAFVLSDNEKYYEAIDGLCHPDCPAWPSCLDNTELTCTINNQSELPDEGLKTIDWTVDAKDRQNFPAYIKDTRLGYDGEVTAGIGGINVITPDLLIPILTAYCGEGCTPILVTSPNIGNDGLSFTWTCDCGPGEDDGEDDPPNDKPPVGQVKKCDCFVYSDHRKPGGRIILNDTQLGHEGVRRVKVKTTKRYWGFIWRNTDTDDNGCWKIDERYNVRRAKTKVVFKDRVSDRITIRSFRGIRFWNATIKPVKHRWRMKRNNKRWNEQCLVIEDSGDNMSRNEQTFIAATTNRALPSSSCTMPLIRLYLR